MRIFSEDRVRCWPRRPGLRAALAAVALASAAWGGTYGRVVPIGGEASDIALDEARGLLYIANFAGNRIDLMKTSDFTISKSINVNPLPGSIALSRDGQWLLVAHYGNFSPPASLDASLTLINLNSNTIQTLAANAAPLAVAFGADGLALVVTTAEVDLLDPATAIFQTIASIPSLNSTALPVTAPSFPVQITQSTLGVSGDGMRIYGTTNAYGIIYDVASQSLGTFPTAGAEPPFGPRNVSANQDGSLFAFAWVLFNGAGGIEAEFTDPTGQFNVGGYAIDSAAGLLYMQLPDVVNQTAPPTLQARDLNSLALRETYQLPENLAGKSLVGSNHVIYSISDSGVIVFQTGAANQPPRLQAAVEDLVFRGSFCSRGIASQTLTITDPSGGATDFTLTASTPGITITPSSGTTVNGSATVTVSVDPNVFANQNGTLSASIQITSQSAVNVPLPVRVLINTSDPDQRGAVIDVPGKLVDILADPTRNRFYIVRQDQNEVLVFDGATYRQTAVLPVSLSPTQLAITSDGKYLLIGHEDATTVYVYDLNTLKQQPRIYFPYGHIPRSIAVSGGAILGAAHNRVVGGLNSVIDRIDLNAGFATEIPSLGPLKNSLASYTVLAATPNGSSILGVVADGSFLLYDANSDTFPVYRQDYKSMSGAYAASNFGQFVVGNYFLNSSLVTVRQLNTAGGVATGFAFTDQFGLLASSTGASAPGFLERVDLSKGAASGPTRTVESTVVPFPIVVPATPVAGSPPPPPAPDPNVSPFTRTVAPLPGGNAIILLTQSGFTVLPPNFDAATAQPVISDVVNTADPTQPLTGGGLISIEGTNLSTTVASSSGSPLPTTLAGSCVTLNGSTIPLFMVSPPDINAQLPLDITGGTLIVYTPGGVSNPFTLNAQPTAPSVIQVPSSPGSNTMISAIYRAANNLLVTLTNPVHKGDHLIIYASGLGDTNPPVAAGQTAPSKPQAVVITQPTVTLGGVKCPVTLAILEPGQIGVYQIDVNIPQGITEGDSIPLSLTQGGSTSTVGVRVVQ